MLPRERVEAVLRGEMADCIPFTAYENKTCATQTERALRNAGMCIIERRISVYEMRTPGITEETIYFRGEDDLERMRKLVRTPRGTLEEVYQVIAGHPRMAGHSLPWHEEFFLKGPEDYAAIEFMIRSRQYRPTYEEFSRRQEEAGGDVLLVQTVGYSPLQEIIYNIMGIERFAVEWHERRDELMRIYDALTEDRRKRYQVIADSPAAVVTYGGNISPEVVGVERFRKYIAPHYDELAEMLHPRGKRLMVHFDGSMRLVAPAVAESKLDIVEAFTPEPTGDMSLAEARQIWANKILWLNFPSSVHLEEDAAIEEATRQLLRQAGSGERLLMGITENVPDHRWQPSFSAILRVLNTEGRLPLQGQ